MRDPIHQFEKWYAEAERSEPTYPDAMTVATVGPDGAPSARLMLLKGFDEKGFVFYTNLESRKGRELKADPRAALCFHWKSLKRQVRIEGTVEPVTEAEADAYFATRPRLSRIGAWASKQSQPLEGPMALEGRVAKYGARFIFGSVPRPPFWSGFRLRPRLIEFWEELPFRLHRRERFERAEGAWSLSRLYP